MKKTILICVLLVLIVIGQSCTESGTNNQVTSDSTTNKTDTIKKPSTDTGSQTPKTDTIGLKTDKQSEPRLVSVHLTITVTGDGIDRDGSTVLFRVHHPNYPNVADYPHIGYVGDNDIYQKDLDLKDNRLKKDEIKNSLLYLQITANGRDTFRGNPTATFTYSDGEKISVNYRPFEIGTFHMSNTTDQPVVP